MFDIGKKLLLEIAWAFIRLCLLLLLIVGVVSLVIVTGQNPLLGLSILNLFGIIAVLMCLYMKD